MLEGEDTGVAQQAAKSFKSLVQLTEAVWSSEDGEEYTQQIEQLLT